MYRFTIACYFMLLNIALVFGQETLTHSVYFDLDSYEINESELNPLQDLAKQIDTSRIQSIKIFGYCDDRGKDDYNYTLSENRATAIKNILIRNHIEKKISFTIQGKGKIALETDTDIEKARTNNRRVDIQIKINRRPNIFNAIQKDHVVNDRVFLLNIFFETSSDLLTSKSTDELDRVVSDLQKYPKIKFEIQGHVCCIADFNSDAINRRTKERTLSVDRAIQVYDYLLKKGISAKRMKYKGFGNSRPIEGAKDHFNRRVELMITKVE